MTVYSLYQYLKYFLLLLLLLGTLAVVILSFYLSVAPTGIVTQAGAYTFFDALGLFWDKPVTLLFNPQQLSADEKNILSVYGQTLIFGISILAVLLSSVTISTKLALVEQLVPYEKYDLWYRWVFRCISIFYRSPKRKEAFEAWKSSAYKNLAVSKMYHFYRGADKLLIISGDYSWLFDTKWSPIIRKLIEGKLPDAKLISYKRPIEVANSWQKYPESKTCKRLFSSIAFTTENCEHKGSIVKQNTTNIYIHLYREVRRSARRESVCVFYGDWEAGALVAFVESELSRIHATAENADQSEKLKIADDSSFFDQ